MILKNQPGVHNYLDDSITFKKTPKEHEKYLLNQQAEIEFGQMSLQSELSILWHIILQTGLKPDLNQQLQKHHFRDLQISCALLGHIIVCQMYSKLCFSHRTVTSTTPGNLKLVSKQ